MAESTDTQVVRQAGYTVLCDIAEFSEKPSHLQKECVCILDRCAVATSLIKELAGKSPQQHVLNCTGDGFVLIVTDQSVREHPDKLLHFVRELLIALKKWNDGKEVKKQSKLAIQVRIGIHSGEFYMGIPLFGQPNAIGTGVNMAARIASVGDPGHVLVSDTVVRQLVDTAPTGGVKTRVGIEPLLDSPPSWQVAVKHGVELSVSPWSCSQGGYTLGSSAKPRRVLQFEAVEAAILRELRRLAERLEERITAVVPVSPQDLNLRVSLLLARRNTKGQREVVCTPLRVMRKGKEIPFLGPSARSDVRYPLDPPVGMPAHVLDRAERADSECGQALCQHRLPEWSGGTDRASAQARKRYIAHITAAWGLPEATVLELGRKARTYLGRAVPALGREPFSVVMVDSDHPLSQLSKKSVLALAEAALSLKAMMALAALVQLRYMPS